MRNWGLGLPIWGALTLFAYIEPGTDYTDEEQSWLLGFSLAIVAGGSLLAYKGQHYINSVREIAEVSLHQIREKDYIDALELSKIFQISEIDVRHKIAKAKAKKFIPFDVVIR